MKNYLTGLFLTDHKPIPLFPIGTLIGLQIKEFEREPGFIKPSLNNFLCAKASDDRFITGYRDLIGGTLRCKLLPPILAIQEM